jgi:hypothetical protein
MASWRPNHNGTPVTFDGIQQIPLPISSRRNLHAVGTTISLEEIPQPQFRASQCRLSTKFYLDGFIVVTDPNNIYSWVLWISNLLHGAYKSTVYTVDSVGGVHGHYSC